MLENKMDRHGEGEISYWLGKWLWKRKKWLILMSKSHDQWWDYF